MRISWITSFALPFVPDSIDRCKSSIFWLLTVLVGAGAVLVVDNVSATMDPGFPFAHRGRSKVGLWI